MPDQRSADKVAVTIWLDRDLKAKLTAKAEEEGETVTDVLTRAVKRYVR